MTRTRENGKTEMFYFLEKFNTQSAELFLEQYDRKEREKERGKTPEGQVATRAFVPGKIF